MPTATVGTERDSLSERLGQSRHWQADDVTDLSPLSRVRLPRTRPGHPVLCTLGASRLGSHPRHTSGHRSRRHQPLRTHWTGPTVPTETFSVRLLAPPKDLLLRAEHRERWRPAGRPPSWTVRAVHPAPCERMWGLLGHSEGSPVLAGYVVVSTGLALTPGLAG